MNYETPYYSTVVWVDEQHWHDAHDTLKAHMGRAWYQDNLSWPCTDRAREKKLGITMSTRAAAREVHECLHGYDFDVEFYDCDNEEVVPATKGDPATDTNMIPHNKAYPDLTGDVLNFAH